MHNYASRITPQPNKYAEFLLPKQPIDRLTKFIIEEEGWYLVELDKSSVPGVMYLSATEDKINFINDDLKNEIGDADKLAKYDFIFPEKEESFKVGEQINLTFSITKDGIPISVPCIVSFKDRKVVKKQSDDTYIAIAEGEAIADICLKDYPQYSTTRKVIISNFANVSGFINGPTFIRLDRQASYTFILTGADLEGEVSYEMDGELASIISTESATCIVKANKKNKFTKDKIEECSECEYRYACFDCRPNSLSRKISEKPWYCTYNPLTGNWEDIDGFILNLKGKLRK